MGNNNYFTEINPAKISELQQLSENNDFNINIGKETIVLSRNLLKFISLLGYTVMIFSFNFLIDFAVDKNIISETTGYIFDSLTDIIIPLSFIFVQIIINLINKRMLKQLELKITSSDNLIIRPLKSIISDIFREENFVQIPYSDNYTYETKQRFSEDRNSIYYMISMEEKDNYVLIFATADKMKEINKGITKLSSVFRYNTNNHDNEVPKSIIWDYNEKKLTIRNSEIKSNLKSNLLTFIGIVLSIVYFVYIYYIFTNLGIFNPSVSLYLFTIMSIFTAYILLFNTRARPGTIFRNKTIKIIIDNTDPTIKDYIIRKKLLPLYDKKDIFNEIHEGEYGSVFFWQITVARDVKRASSFSKTMNTLIQSLTPKQQVLLSISVKKQHAKQLFNDIQMLLGYTLEIKERSYYLKKVYQDTAKVLVDEKEKINMPSINFSFNNYKKDLLTISVIFVTIIITVVAILSPIFIDPQVSDEYLIYEKDISSLNKSFDTIPNTFMKIEITTGLNYEVGYTAIVAKINDKTIINREMPTEYGTFEFKEVWVKGDQDLILNISTDYPVSVKIYSGYRHSYNFYFTAIMIVAFNILISMLAVDKNPISDTLLRQLLENEYRVEDDIKLKNGISLIAIAIILLLYNILFQLICEILIIFNYFTEEIFAFRYLQYNVGTEIIVFVLYIFGNLILASSLAMRKAERYKIYHVMIISLLVSTISLFGFPIIYNIF